MRGILLTFLTLSVNTANSQENHPKTPAITAEQTDVIKAIYKKEKLPASSLESKSPVNKALEILNNANTLYNQKRYNLAIVQYQNATNYLFEKDASTQKILGQTYTKLAESYKRIQNREKTAFFYQQALNIFTALNDKKYMARTLNTLAEAERYLGNLVIALNYSTQSLAIHKTIDDPGGYAKALMGAGIIYRHIGRYEKSLDHIHEAYLYHKKVNDSNSIAKASNEMGHIYIRLEQFEQAKYFFKATIDIANNKVNDTTLASALREMAIIYLDAGDYPNALLVALKAHKIYQNEKDQLKESLTARIIANIYRAQQDNVNAITYYRNSIAFAIDNNNKEYQVKAQNPLAAILIANNTDEAVTLLLESLELSKQIHNKDQTLYAYRTLRQAEDYRGDFKKALYYAKKEIALIRLIQNEKDEEELILAKANLHSHKMEIELQSLREKVQLDQLELTKKNSAIEIAEQSRTINELELMKNKYASVALACLLIMCLLSILYIFRRFTASKKLNEELDYLASRDPLTNTYNRRSLLELMNNYFAKADRDNEYCIIMADIDHFKSVNDTYGHSKGDVVIRGVAAILQSCIRQNDIVSRFGGEEFCIVLHKVSQEQAMSIAEAMRHKIENSVFDDVSITSSFGVSSLQFKARIPSELIEQADVALYRSKSLGRNKVTLWDGISPILNADKQ